jgi:hypothetical protein
MFELFSFLRSTYWFLKTFRHWTVSFTPVASNKFTLATKYVCQLSNFVVVLDGHGLSILLSTSAVSLKSFKESDGAQFESCSNSELSYVLFTCCHSVQHWFDLYCSRFDQKIYYSRLI